jgi:hypothetical protein
LLADIIPALQQPERDQDNWALVPATMHGSSSQVAKLAANFQQIVEENSRSSDPQPSREDVDNYRVSAYWNRLTRGPLRPSSTLEPAHAKKEISLRGIRAAARTRGLENSPPIRPLATQTKNPSIGLFGFTKTSLPSRSGGNASIVSPTPRFRS